MDHNLHKQKQLDYLLPDSMSLRPIRGMKRSIPLGTRQ
jgi:hypothetical protein